MAGIYIHIPFCRKACHYCNFHFSTSLKLKNEFLDALLAEAEIRQDYLGPVEAVETVYFGGGTPSLLTAVELELLADKIRQLWHPVPGAEWTLEANPDDINPEQAGAWLNAGINRLSIGIQSFFDEDLQLMNRTHNSSQAIRSVETVQAAGFHNISLDLIYGIPGMDDQRWKKNVDRSLSLGVPHLSCYALTIEPRTAWEKMIRDGRRTAIDPDDQARQFQLLMEWLPDAGFEQYEISNFARPGFRSRHNASYWTGIPYIGLGPSAHSYDGNSRQWNISNNAEYIRSIGKGIPAFEREEIDDRKQLNEYIMTSLRRLEGLNLDYVMQQYSSAAADQLVREAAPFLKEGLLLREGNQLRLSLRGKLLADGIAARLFQL